MGHFHELGLAFRDRPEDGRGPNAETFARGASPGVSARSTYQVRRVGVYRSVPAPEPTTVAAGPGPPRSHPRRAPSPPDVSHVLRGLLLDVRATIFAPLTCFGFLPFEAFLLRADVPVAHRHGDPFPVFPVSNRSETSHPQGFVSGPEAVPTQAPFSGASQGRCSLGRSSPRSRVLAEARHQERDGVGLRPSSESRLRTGDAKHARARPSGSAAVSEDTIVRWRCETGEIDFPSKVLVTGRLPSPK